MIAVRPETRQEEPAKHYGKVVLASRHSHVFTNWCHASNAATMLLITPVAKPIHSEGSLWPPRFGLSLTSSSGRMDFVPVGQLSSYSLSLRL